MYNIQQAYLTFNYYLYLTGLDTGLDTGLCICATQHGSMSCDENADLSLSSLQNHQLLSERHRIVPYSTVFYLRPYLILPYLR